MRKKILTATLVAALAIFAVQTWVLHASRSPAQNAYLLADKGGVPNTGGGNSGGTGGNNGNNGGGNSGGTGGNNGGGTGGGTAGAGGNAGGTAAVSGVSGNGGGRGGVPGRGLRQHAAALNRILSVHGVHTDGRNTYQFLHPNVHPAAFADRKAEEQWGEHLHEVTCSLFRYLSNIKQVRPLLQPGYFDWLANDLAQATGEDVAEIKAALLGFPHHHAHTHGTAPEDGCERGPQSADATVEGQIAREHLFYLHSTGTGASRFAIDDRITDTEIAFRITESGSALTTLGLAEGSELHLAMVRDDLEGFAHVHPVRDAEGVWRMPFIPAAQGTYWFYIDVADEEGITHTIRFSHTYGHATQGSGASLDMRHRKEVGPYLVILEGMPYSDGTLYTYHIYDDNADVVFPEPHHGYIGHGTLISPTGDYIHTHPSIAGDNIALYLENGLQGTYRLFTQFKIQGEIYTVVFDIVGLE